MKKEFLNDGDEENEEIKRNESEVASKKNRYKPDKVISPKDYRFYALKSPKTKKQSKISMSTLKKDLKKDETNTPDNLKLKKDIASRLKWMKEEARGIFPMLRLKKQEQIINQRKSEILNLIPDDSDDFLLKKRACYRVDRIYQPYVNYSQDKIKECENMHPDEIEQMMENLLN